MFINCKSPQIRCAAKFEGVPSRLASILNSEPIITACYNAFIRGYGNLLMTEDKKKLSKLCLTGFIFSVLPLGLLAVAVFLGGCKKEEEQFDTRNKNYEPTETVLSQVSESSGEVNGYKYTLTRPEEYGPDLDYGWYIREVEDEQWVLICNGMESTGGHFIEVTNIEYDKATDTVVIRVLHTRDPEICTDAYTHPFCYVKFKNLPDNIKVIAEEDQEVVFGGKVINTEEWAVDVQVDDDYTLILSGSSWKSDHAYTYVYKIADDQYRYINVVRNDKYPGETFVKGRGTCTSFEALEYYVYRFGTWRTVLVKGDENNPIPIEEYLKSYNS